MLGHVRVQNKTEKKKNLYFERDEIQLNPQFQGHWGTGN